MSGQWLIYRRRSNKKLGSAHVIASAEVSDQTQLEKCLALLPPDVSYEVIDDLGGRRSGRSAKRKGWLEVVRRVTEGGIAGVVAYDVSRLARKTKLILDLKEEMEKHRTQLRIATMPDVDWDSAAGEMILTNLAATSAMLAKMDSERMRDMMRATFEAGGHRGNDPFGYATARDESGVVVQPRRLVIVPGEAEVVRRVFEMLERSPFSEIADQLNREGVRHREVRAWTVNAIKDLWRRREVYIGNVATRRGAEVRPGQHEAILTDEQYRRAVAGVQSRIHHTGKKPGSAKRTYLLRGLVYCSCGTKMHGTATLSRGQNWRYYICPVAEGKRAVLGDDGELVECHASRVPAVAAERLVASRLRELMRTEEAIARARAKIAAGIGSPEPGTAAKERERLTTRLDRLKDMFGWGDLSEAEYRAQVTEVRAQIAALPGPNGQLIEFDTYHKRAKETRTLAEMMDAASLDKLQELVPLLVERIETADQHVVRIVPKDQAKPHYAWAEQDERVGLAPPDGLGGV